MSTHGASPGLLPRVATWIEAYFDGLDRRRVVPDSERSPSRDAEPWLPDDAVAPGELLRRLERDIVPGLVHWNHPGFMAWFTSTSSAAGVAGSALAAALNANTMMEASAPSAVAMERALLTELGEALGLGGDRTATLTSGGSESTFLAMLAARERASGGGAATRGLDGTPLGLFVTEATHTSVEKAARMAGLGADALRVVPRGAGGGMCPDGLAREIARCRAHGGVACAVVATIGTTATTAVDPVPELVAVARRAGVWIHVDAAHAGGAALLPELRARFAGWHHADSVVVNPHKWLFTPLGCSFLSLREPIWLRRVLSTRATYLSDAADVEPMDLGVALGRPPRALPLWWSLAAEGLEAVRDRIRMQLGLARSFAAWVAQHPRLILVQEPPFSTVVFRLARTAPGAGPACAPSLPTLVQRVNAGGRVFLTTASDGGPLLARAVFSGYRTGPPQLRALQAEIDGALAL